MPNWCFIKLSCDDICKDERFYTIDAGGKKYLDFKKIIPEPKTAKECRKNYGEEYIDKHDISKMLLTHTKGNEWFNWYDWHIAFWGTKWDACEVDYDDDLDIIYFQTAWSFPTPVIKKISEMLPGKNVVCEVEYEGEQGYDIVIYRDGKLYSAEPVDKAREENETYS